MVIVQEMRCRRHSSTVKPPAFDSMESEPSSLQVSGVGALKIKRIDQLLFFFFFFLQRQT